MIYECGVERPSTAEISTPGNLKRQKWIGIKLALLGTNKSLSFEDDKKGLNN